MITWINHQINRNSLNPNLIFFHTILSSHGQKSWTHVFPRRVKQQSLVWRANEMPRGLSDTNTADISATHSTFTTGQSRWFGYKFLQVMAHVILVRNACSIQLKSKRNADCFVPKTHDWLFIGHTTSWMEISFVNDTAHCLLNSSAAQT